MLRENNKINKLLKEKEKEYNIKYEKVNMFLINKNDDSEKNY